MSGRNVNIYLPEETYNKIKDLIEQRKVSKFVSEAIEEKLEREKEQEEEEEQEEERELLSYLNKSTLTGEHLRHSGHMTNLPDSKVRSLGIIYL